MTRREKAIKRRRKFLITVCISFLLIIAIIVSVVSCTSNKTKSKNSDNSKSSSHTTESNSVSESSSYNTSSLADNNSEITSSSNPEMIIDTVLDKKYSNIMLINGKNPLPQNYDSDIRPYLVEIDKDLRNNNYVTKIHRTVYPYIVAMVEAAHDDGVDLRVWSPFRSYADQKTLFEKQVARVGGDEEKAATVVARPGTSEHNSGICADFNMADDAFENTSMYDWMCKNAENYGFILRYPKNKESQTGVIYESWHWRFVGIDMAKKINKSGLCLEEYLEKYNLKQEISIYNF